MQRGGGEASRLQQLHLLQCIILNVLYLRFAKKQMQNITLKLHQLHSQKQLGHRSQNSLLFAVIFASTWTSAHHI